MKLKKLFIIPLVLVLMCGFGTVAFASTEEVVEDLPVEEATPAYTVSVKFTDDSSTLKGISYEPYVDPVTFAVGFKIVEDLPFGHVIYDNPETPYIDGVRVNDETVDTLTFAIENGTTYNIVVRTVYEDNLLGDVAKIIDGKFDFKTLLDNPLLLLTGIYYVVSILSVICAAFASMFSKTKKVKTADEIASKVTESSDKAVEKVRTEVTEVVLAEVKPILQRILDDLQNVITAVALSTSKNREAPLAMLDTLQKSAEAANVADLMDSIRKAVSEGIAKDDATHSENLEALHEIAKKVESLSEPKTTPTEPPSNGSNKSVF